MKAHMYISCQTQQKNDPQANTAAESIYRELNNRKQIVKEKYVQEILKLKSVVDHLVIFVVSVIQPKLLERDLS